MKLLPVCHVAPKHLFNFVDVELARPAESQIECVIKPGIVCDLVVNDPLLQLIQNLRLFFR